MPEDKEFIASEARRLSEEPLLVQALSTMEARAIDELMYCEDDRRTEFIVTLRVVRSFRSNLSAIIAEGNRPSRGGIA